MAPSINDLHKHNLLQQTVPSESLRPAFAFLAITESYNKDCGTGIKGFDRALFKVTRKDDVTAEWDRFQLQVPNLGDTDASKRRVSLLLTSEL